MWNKMNSAPKDGTTIIGKYGNDEHPIVYSERPVCMLGSRDGGLPPGRATSGDDSTDSNLPMDEPEMWR